VKEKIENKIILLGVNLRELRLSKNLTQLELSIDSGVPLSQIGAIETGKVNTTIKTLIKLSESLDVKVNDLINF
jgi:transcriptional regulator with XRE-family HTH domain